MGADDYVNKPFSPRELVARVEAVARRGRRDAARLVALEDGVADLTALEVRRGAARAPLTATEAGLLALLAGHPGRVFPRGELLDRVRGADAAVTERAIDAHIVQLRRKVERDPRHPRRILTVWGVGYRWRAPD